MKNILNKVYYIKIVLFIVQFFFVFRMLHNILDAGIFGTIFIILYIAFALKILAELFFKKPRYKTDVIYNMMQIGIYAYLIVIASKTTLAKVYVTEITMGYFRTNYIILSILILFVFAYDFLENSEKNM